MTRSGNYRIWLALATTLATGATAAAAHANGDAPATLAPFEATYRVVYKGISAGTSTMTLRHLEGDRWTYQSSSTPRGIFRLFLPDNISQRSEMRIDGTAVVPLKYSAGGPDDPPDRTIDVNFDWQNMRVTGVDREEPIDLPLQPGVQDDLSAQVLLMRDLITGQPPASFLKLGRGSIDEQQFERQGTETIDSPLGPLETVIYRSQRIGSPRSSLFWCAPSLGYLPVRARQSRGDKVEFVMELASFKRS